MLEGDGFGGHEHLGGEQAEQWSGAVDPVGVGQQIHGAAVLDDVRHVEPVGVVGGGGAEGAAVGGGDGVQREREVPQHAAGGLGGPGVEVGGEVEDGGGVGVGGVVFQDPGGGGVVGVPHPVQEVVDAAVAEGGGVQPGGEDLGGGAAEEPVGVGAAVVGGVDAGDERAGAAVRDGVVGAGGDRVPPHPGVAGGPPVGGVGEVDDRDRVPPRPDPAPG